MGNYTEYNTEAPVVNPYINRDNLPAKEAGAISQGLQNTPGGVTTDHLGNTTQNLTTQTEVTVPAGQEGDVLKSARTAFGSPSAQITDDTIVTISGVTATVRAAVKAGLITKNADGLYGEVSKQAPVAAQKRDRVDPLTSDSRTRVQALENIVGKQNADNIMHRMIAAAGRGEGLHGVQKELADLAGIQPEATTAILEGIATDLDAKISRTIVQETGLNQVEGEKAIDWMLENLPATHMSAVFAGALHDDTGALKVAFEKYRLSLRKSDNS